MTGRFIGIAWLLFLAANFTKHVSSSSPFKPLRKPVFNFVAAKSA